MTARLDLQLALVTAAIVLLNQGCVYRLATPDWKELVGGLEDPPSKKPARRRSRLGPTRPSQPQGAEPTSNPR